jgi:hypothetical protein
VSGAVAFGRVCKQNDRTCCRRHIVSQSTSGDAGDIWGVRLLAGRPDVMMGVSRCAQLPGQYLGVGPDRFALHSLPCSHSMLPMVWVTGSAVKRTACKCARKELAGSPLVLMFPFSLPLPPFVSDLYCALQEKHDRL